MISNSIRTILAIVLVAATSVAVADTSDYIWVQQFEKKMKLANEGDAQAQYDVGKMLQKGQGTKRNAEEAFNWFSKAAEQGHTRAGYKVGYMYYKGEGVSKNSSKAFKWVKKAADEDYTPAMFYLGQLYAKGAGTGKDLNEALKWYKKAEAGGYHPAKAAVKNTEQQLAQAAPPPPPRRAPAAPARTTTVAKAPAPAPVKKSKPVSSGGGNMLASLIGTQWKKNGKAAAEFPSGTTDCSVSNDRIVCNSKEMEVEEPYGTVSYTVQSMIGNFAGKEFSNQYRRNVTLIFPSDPDNPDVKIPIDYGPQPPELMRCKLIGNNNITCTTQDNKVVKYKK